MAYDPDYDYGDTEQEYYERLAEAAGCDEPEWFDIDLMPVYGSFEEAEAAA